MPVFILDDANQNDGMTVSELFLPQNLRGLNLRTFGPSADRGIVVWRTDALRALWSAIGNALMHNDRINALAAATPTPQTGGGSTGGTPTSDGETPDGSTTPPHSGGGTVH